LEKAIREGKVMDAPATAEQTSLALDELLNLDPGQFRARVYSDLVKEFSNRDRFILERVFGREAELCYVALTVERALGVDVIDDIAAAMNRQMEAISAEPDARFVEFRRLISALAIGLMIKAVEDIIPPETKVEDGEFEKLCIETYFTKSVSSPLEMQLTPILEDVRTFAKEHKLSEKLGPKTLGGWYKKLGIVSGRNKHHGVKGDYLSIDSRTWQKITNSVRAEAISLQDLPKADSIDSIDSIDVAPEPSPAIQTPSGESIIASIESIESGKEALK
jgi:hypothetical protein